LPITAHKAVKAVRRKHNLFSKYKDTSHPAYIKASCAARKEVKRAKRNFEAKLSTNITRAQLVLRWPTGT